MRKHCNIHESRLDSGHEQYTSFLLMNKSVFDHLDPATTAMLAPAASSSTCVHYSNMFDFCSKTGVPAAALSVTMAAYNACQEGISDSFGKKCFPVSDFRFDDPLCVVTVTPVLSHSLGGLHVS